MVPILLLLAANFWPLATGFLLLGAGDWKTVLGQRLFIPERLFVTNR